MKSDNSDEFKIYADRLLNGEREELHGTSSADFIAVDDEDLRFKSPVSYQGEAYIASNELVVHLNVETVCEAPCAICNRWSPISLKLEDYFDVCPLEDIKGHIYDFSENLREELLLQVPFSVECEEGCCPKRKELERYLKQDEGEPSNEQRPFADL